MSLIYKTLNTRLPPSSTKKSFLLKNETIVYFASVQFQIIESYCQIARLLKLIELKKKEWRGMGEIKIKKKIFRLTF